MQYKVTVEEICTYEIEVEATTEHEASEEAHAMISNAVTFGVKQIAYQLNTIDIAPPKLSVGIKDNQ